MPYAYTDLGNAMLFRDLCLADNIRYVPESGTWVRHDGVKWSPIDSTSHVMGMVGRVIAARQAEAVEYTDQTIRHRVEEFSTTSESDRSIQAMIRLSKMFSEVVLALDEMDSDPWQLNVENGVVDLRTGLLIPHSINDRYMKAVPCRYEAAQCPKWRQFLLEVMCDRSDLVAYLQRAIGYSLTGTTSEEVMFIPYGSGANGKTIMLETLRDIFGTYSQTADPSTFLVRKGSAIRNDLACLHGSRFVTAVETGRGDHLDAVMVKRMTSCDMLKARFLFKELFEFRPTWKIWMATNSRPLIPDTDHGIWRRIQVIPFDRRFQVVHGEGDKIRRALWEERNGILAWAIEGCLQWQKSGLMPPPSVESTINDYQDELDNVSAFVRQSCYRHPDASISVSDLYKTYLGWCKQEAEKAVGKIEFGRTLSHMGVGQMRRTNHRYWSGIAISNRVSLTNLSDTDPGDQPFQEVVEEWEEE